MAPAVMLVADEAALKLGGDQPMLIGDAVKDFNDPELHTNELMSILLELVTWVSVGSIIFGGVVPYIPQYRTIRKTRDAEGFSTFVCLVLLVANILRILFWFSKRFELPLLLQSVIMIGCMLTMMHICVRVKSDKVIVARRLTDFNMEHFWKWTRFRDYCMFLGVFMVAISAITFLLGRVSLYMELLGLTSLLMEACLGLPQLWRNHSNKSTEGMSVQMVMMWFSGDLFKTGYFFLRHSPKQFWVCGTIQVMVDICILLQVFFYQKRTLQPTSSKQNRPN